MYEVFGISRCIQSIHKHPQYYSINSEHLDIAWGRSELIIMYVPGMFMQTQRVSRVAGGLFWFSV